MKNLIRFVCLLVTFLCIPSLANAGWFTDNFMKTPDIDRQEGRELTVWEDVPINGQIVTSHIILRLGDPINLMTAECLLGKAISTTGRIKTTHASSVEQITFQYGSVTTESGYIQNIKVFENMPTNVKPVPWVIGLAKVGSPLKALWNPSHNTMITSEMKLNASTKKIIYQSTNMTNYVSLIVDIPTNRVKSFELGLIEE